MSDSMIAEIQRCEDELRFDDDLMASLRARRALVCPHRHPVGADRNGASVTANAGVAADCAMLPASSTVHRASEGHAASPLRGQRSHGQAQHRRAEDAGARAPRLSPQWAPPRSQRWHGQAQHG